MTRDIGTSSSSVSTSFASRAMPSRLRPRKRVPDLFLKQLDDEGDHLGDDRVGAHDRKQHPESPAVRSDCQHVANGAGSPPPMPGWWSEYTRLKVRRSNLTLPAYGLHSHPTSGRAGKCRSVRVAARSRSRLCCNLLWSCPVEIVCRLELGTNAALLD